MALVPQVVDAVSPIPVVAAGGIFDGRGIAAALMLGAAGVNLGTRFITSIEAPAPNEWKEAITAAQSEDVIKVDVLNDISPIPGTKGFPTIPRSLPTAFLSEWSAKREEARRERDRLRGQIVSTTQAGRQHECILWAGQTAGGISEILPVATIMRRLIAETEAALSSVTTWSKQMRYEPAKLPQSAIGEPRTIRPRLNFPSQIASADNRVFRVMSARPIATFQLDHLLCVSSSA
jgi:enoyl-[acyl-carrier protein] reductase II